MKRSGILNDRLSASIAALGHGDILLVVDAGFPIPRAAERIDLAITRDLPDLRTVLQLVHAEIHVERVLFAREISQHTSRSTPHPGRVRRGRARPPAARGHARPRRARGETIVRTGAFDPWGNIGLVCGVDVGAYFSKDGVDGAGVVPRAFRGCDSRRQVVAWRSRRAHRSTGDRAAARLVRPRCAGIDELSLDDLRASQVPTVHGQGPMRRSPASMTAPSRAVRRRARAHLHPAG